ncbi:hypothetical protein GCM10020331_099730 [Ectobacillus funiculus]
MEEKKSRGLNQTNHNGSMAQNEEEIKQLGKEMESMQTHTELYENGWIPDPIQYEDKKMNILKYQSWIVDRNRQAYSGLAGF